MSDSARAAVIESSPAAMAVVLVRRGAAADASRALRERYGLDLPAPGRLQAAHGVTLIWQGPKRFLAIGGEETAGLAQDLQQTLQGFAYVVDASSARQIVEITGEGARTALSKLLPIDLHPRVFGPDSVALTVAAHIDVHVWRQDATDSFHLAFASSLADSFRHHLAAAIAGGGAGQPRS